MPTKPNNPDHKDNGSGERDGSPEDPTGAKTRTAEGPRSGNAPERAPRAGVAFVTCPGCGHIIFPGQKGRCFVCEVKTDNLWWHRDGRVARTHRSVE